MIIIACGWRHTITVSSSGCLYTCGWSKYGQLGHGDFNDHLIPHQVEVLKDCCISQVWLLVSLLLVLFVKLDANLGWYKTHLYPLEPHLWLYKVILRIIDLYYYNCSSLGWTSNLLMTHVLLTSQIKFNHSFKSLYDIFICHK